MIRNAWKQISNSTILNCFAKSNLVDNNNFQENTTDLELNSIWENLPSEDKMYDKEQIELNEFLKADNNLMKLNDWWILYT